MNDNIKAGGDIHAGDGGYSIGTEEKYNELAKRRNQSMGKMRIQQLALEAGEYVNEVYTPPVRSKTPGKIWEDGHIGWHTQFNQKFAELIVEECATVIERNLYQNIGWNTSRAVKRHFGMEDEE